MILSRNFDRFRIPTLAAGRLGRPVICAVVAAFSFILIACGDPERPATESFYSYTKPPAKQEFRWSNGRAPKSLDPALATAPPETDLARAAFEGLTELDPETLEAIPGVAERWESSADSKTWTFYLRRDAKWSNGKQVTASDFVRSWKRLAKVADSGTHRRLRENILGMKPPVPSGAPTPKAGGEQLPEAAQPSPMPNSNASPAPSTPSGSEPMNLQDAETQVDRELKKSDVEFGAVARNERTLEVRLLIGDRELPKLLAHPVFRPIFGDGSEFAAGASPATIVTNGPYRFVDGGDSVGLLLERSASYWDRESVKLERVRFVPKANASDALDAYRAGELDAVTNTEFEPLALKLLAPYEDFRRVTHAAINLYEFNTQKPPFNDRNVRRALAMAIERERLAEGELEGSVRPALRYLPFGGQAGVGLIQDVAEARRMLEKAGYPAGENFPAFELAVNRNETQQRIARHVARMWRDNLNISASVVVKEPAEMESMRRSGGYDLIRRGVVFPTSDSMANLRALFDYAYSDAIARIQAELDAARRADTRRTESNSSVANANSSATPSPAPEGLPIYIPEMVDEKEALYEMRAIPLYFPTSYSLVKPYVRGFDVNGLDSPLLKMVAIDSNWQP